MPGRLQLDSLVTDFQKIIRCIDSWVFPLNPLPIIIVPKNLGPDPRPNPAQFAFARDTTDPSGRSDFYAIFEAGLREYFDIDKTANAYAIKVAKEHNISARLKPNDLGLVEIMPYNERMNSLGKAMHEVRHRVQCHSDVPMINQSHTDQIERCRFWGQIQTKHYKNYPHGDHEFDAKFLECYGIFELRRERLQLIPDHVRRLLLMTPEQFLEREKRK